MNDETKEFLHQLLANADQAPRDIVPGGLTVEGLRDMNAIADTYREVTQPGEVMLDVDGMPVGVGPAVTETVYCAAAVIHAKDLAPLDLTVEDARIFWSNLEFYDPDEGETHE